MSKLKLFKDILVLYGYFTAKWWISNYYIKEF